MPVLRYVHVLALAVWLGGMLTLGGLVAPAAFQVLEAQLGADGRPLAGAVFGEVLRRFHLVSYVAGAALVLTLMAMRLLGPRPRQFGLRAGIIGAMLAVALYTGILLTRQIERTQRAIGAPVTTLAPADPQRQRFDRLHRRATSLMLLNIAGGLVLLYWHAKE